MKIFNLTFILFVFATIALTGFMIGPFSLRIPFGIFTGLLLIATGYKIRIDSNIRIFLFFSFFFFVTLVFNGELNKFNFTNYFLGKVFLSLVMYYAVDHFVQDYKAVDKLMLLLSFVALINCICSFLQYFKNPYGDLISMYLINGQQVDQVGFSESQIMSFYENALKIGVPGIFTERVSNGYLAAYSLFLPFFYFFRSKSKVVSIICFFSFLMSLAVLFMTQQRSALAIAVTIVLVILWRNLNFKKHEFILFFLSILLVALVFFANQSISNVEVGRYNDFSDDGRDKIYNASLNFIKENLFLGGPISMAKAISTVSSEVFTPHNFFLTAFGYCGIFGGVMISIIFFRMSFVAGLSLKSFNTSSIVGCMLLCYLLNSLFHNGGLMEGEGMIWFFYALLLKLKYLEGKV